MGRFAIAAYLNVPVYAAFHEWLGRGERLAGMWRQWKEGDRKAALAAIPDSVVDELIVHGPPEKCREHVQRYVDNGVTTPGPGRCCRSGSTRARPCATSPLADPGRIRGWGQPHPARRKPAPCRMQARVRSVAVMEANAATSGTPVRLRGIPDAPGGWLSVG